MTIVGGRSSSEEVGSTGAQGEGQGAEFKSNVFYLYRVRGHNDPILPYRIKGGQPVIYSQLESQLAALYAKIDGKDTIGEGVGDITWRHRAYLIFFYEKEDEVIEEVEFERVSSQGADSFEQGKAVDRIGGTTSPSAFYCVNQMVGMDGQELGRNIAEVFSLSIKHRPRGGGHPIRGHTDAGTNLGPPKT
ncbi:MAG TPA: hypothetical protein VF552_06850 [Allosphingosinicella sp.]|jgi:hypothetical protein